MNGGAEARRTRHDVHTYTGMKGKNPHRWAFGFPERPLPRKGVAASTATDPVPDMLLLLLLLPPPLLLVMVARTRSQRQLVVVCDGPPGLD